MSQHIPRPREEALPFPDFYDEIDLFASEPTLSVAFHQRHRRWLMIISAGLLVLLLVGIVLMVKYRPHIIYRAQRVTQGDLILTMNASGQLHSDVYSINFMGTGKLAEIDVTIGQQVKKGQTLAKLDTISLQNIYHEAQANVAAAQAALDSAKASNDATVSANAANIEAAQTALNTVIAIPLQPKDPLAQTRIDAATEQMTKARGQQVVQDANAQGLINTAQAGLKTAQAQLSTAQYNLNNAVLKAPHDGIVATIDGMVGATPGTTFIQVVDPLFMQIQANVDEANISSIAVGDLVKFSLKAYPGQFFEGKVAGISPLGQFISNVPTYPVLIDSVTNTPAAVHLLSGMTVRATITTNDRPDVLMVPASALRFAQAAINPRTGTDTNISRAQVNKALAQANDMLQNLQQDVSNEQPEASFVLERDSKNKIIIKPIVIGLTDGKVYEVLDGLSTNDVVLVGTRMGND